MLLVPSSPRRTVGTSTRQWATSQKPSLKQSTNYDIHDRDLLAVVRGLANWRHLLAGSPHPITVYTDHKNLQYYRNPQHISQWVAHYIPLLEDYNYLLVHKPGASNHADALSHCPDFDDGSRDNDHTLILSPHLFIDAATTTSVVVKHQLKRMLNLTLTNGA